MPVFLSTAVAKEISKNLNGLSKYPMAAPYLQDILQFGSYKGLAKTRYVNDKQITDHYAIHTDRAGITGAEFGFSDRQSMSMTVSCDDFLSIFYPPAVYQKVCADNTDPGGELLFRFQSFGGRGIFESRRDSFK